MADAFSGPLDRFALWLATEGRPRSPATIRNNCLYLRQLRSYALHPTVLSRRVDTVGSRTDDQSPPG